MSEILGCSLVLVKPKKPLMREGIRQNLNDARAGTRGRIGKTDIWRTHGRYDPTFIYLVSLIPARLPFHYFCRWA
jgi:hypothetical protein